MGITITGISQSNLWRVGILMILVTLGTQDKSFHRLLTCLEELIEGGFLKEKVVVQAGHTKFDSEYMEIFDLVPMDQFEELITEAEVLITHGGVGSIITALKKNKKVIAVARREEYKEHTNNHQLEIIEEFSKQGYLLPVLEIEDLKDAIMKIPGFQPKEFKSNTENMMAIIQNYIK